MDTANTMNKEAKKPKKQKSNTVRLETSELIFKILAYLFCAIFAIVCIYPFVYTVSAALSSPEAVIESQVVLWPVGFQIEAFKAMVLNTDFWVSYANTLFVTLYGTIWSLGVAILGGYALSKKRLPFRSGLGFYLVFTMWFSAGMIPQLTNYENTAKIFESIGISDLKWMVVISMGMNAFNVILLRNAFEGVPKEIEEAAIVDGASEWSLLWSVYVPMSKSSIATVGLFFGLSRWNGYFWASQILTGVQRPLQVFIRDEIMKESSDVDLNVNSPYAIQSLQYAALVFAIIPIIIIYPYLQRYFATGVNVGGVKE